LDDRAFDDYSGKKHLIVARVSSFLIQPPSRLLCPLPRASARFVNATGDELREIFDVRFNSKLDNLDWDIEVMGQGGHIDAKYRSLGRWIDHGLHLCRPQLDAANRFAARCGLRR
jgi:hypothetical protein